MNRGVKMNKEKMGHSRLIAVLNKYSLLFHMVLACGVCFLIEWISRHSFLDACYFVIDRNLVFLYNSLIVFSSLTLVYITKRRAVLRAIICVFWLFLGTINGCILAKRVSPFSYTDLKMVGDLFTMQSNYFSVKEAAIVIAAVALVLFLLVAFWIWGPKYQGKQHPIVSSAMILCVLMMLPNVTSAAVSNNILTSYFENLAQGYKDYGFVYSFSASVLDRGMSAPDDYSEESVNQILRKLEAADSAVESVDADGLSKPAEDAYAGEGNPENSENKTASLEKKDAVFTMSADTDSESEASGSADSEEYPNIICVLLESFVDPSLIRFLETDIDPIPNYHNLYENFTSGYLEVPVVGAGTANTEFEILTGMGMQFFGLGEYPYKTILKETNCESIASDLRTLGYGSHVVHDNGANFYSRRNAFSMMGFDTFTSKEMMDIKEYTPLGTWPTDDIMIGEVEKALDYTPDQQDFVYTITVETHGDYPRESVIEDPAVKVSGAADEGDNYAWEYYVNQLHEMDDFIGKLIDMLSQREEKTFVVMFGDHLPTMGLTEEDMATGSLFQTQYITWNNFGLEKQDKDMTSYQLMADVLEMLDIHTGTMFTFHQNRDFYSDEEEYIADMKTLQYDILYGDHYVYQGENPYPATDLRMGTQDIILDRIAETADYYYFIGKNFTKWSKVFIDESKVSTSYVSSRLLRCKKKVMEEGVHTIVVNQMGSSDTILRSSNELNYIVVTETEPQTEKK